MSNILAIGTAVPDFKMEQMQIYEFMTGFTTNTPDNKRKLKLLYERSGIGTRHSVVPDYHPHNETRLLFPCTRNLEPFPSLEKRMELYHTHASGLGAKAVQHLGVSTVGVTHLITVSCTGMSAPGLDIMLAAQLGLPADVDRSSINFMGCYAAVHALKQAHHICRSNPKARVLIVCVELCTLHFQKTLDYDNLTANAIFSDGAAACLVAGDEALDGAQALVKLNNFYSEIHHSGKNDMAWQLSSSGFLMTLSSYIPQLIEANIERLLENALKQEGLSVKQIRGWAVHPGGRKILDVISSKLALSRTQLSNSYDVLYEYGNMSSATILFVLKRLMQDETLSGPVFGVAFGPGLTMETFIAEKYT